MKKYYAPSLNVKRMTKSGSFFSRTFFVLLVALMACSMVQAQESAEDADGYVNKSAGDTVVRRMNAPSAGIEPMEKQDVKKEGKRWNDGVLKMGGAKSASNCREKIFGGTDNYIYYGTENNSVCNTAYNYSHTQFIIKKTEMDGYYGSCGATIYKICFYLSPQTYRGSGSSFLRSWAISMGHTGNAQYNNSTFLTGLTQVFSGNVSFSTDGWYEITLTTPFAYNGTQNLVIDVKDNSGSNLYGLLGTTTRPIFAYTAYTNMSVYRHNDNSNNNTQTSGTRADYRPYCILCMSPRSNLTYNTNGNGNCTTGTVIAGANCVEELTLTTTIPTTGGGTFIGWCQSPDGYGTIFNPGDDVVMPGGDVTLYAIYHGSLTYNTTANCPAGGNATTIASVEDRQVAHVTSVIPTCSSTGSFRYWNTAPDGSGTTYLAGDEVRLDCYGNVTLYAIYCNEAYHVSINGCEHQEGDDAGEPCYIDVCLNTSGSHNVTLTATSDMPNPTYRWAVNKHDGDGYVNYTGNNQTVTIPANADLMGYDIQVTAQSAEGCIASTYGRVRTSKGLHAEVPDEIPPFCAGSDNTITIGTSGTSIVIDEPSLHIEASLGQGVQTFIPDGPNCESLGECYSSSVEFRDFDPDAVVEQVSDIDYIRINMEHSFIGDLQIKLICPNGQNSIILQDHDNALDPDVYDWPYVTVAVWGVCYRYNKTGNCQRGSYEGLYYTQYYVVRNGSSYTLTGDQANATLFTESELTTAVLNAIYNQTQSTTSVADWCDENYYNSFYDIETPDGESPQSKIFVGLGFGNPNHTDNTTTDHICDAAYNASGTGLDYCWSANPEYSYATGYVYSPANHIVGVEAEPYVKPSNEEAHTNFYHPFQDFSNLIGCPLNGTWTVQICDSWALDNGYIFNWSLALSDDKLPDSWGYTISAAGSELSCLTGSLTHTIDPNDYSVEITPSATDDGTGCSVIITDNIGCETVVDLNLTVDVPRLTPAAGNNDDIQVCQGGSIGTNSWTLGGIATGATIAWQKDGVDITSGPVTFTVNGNNVTLGGGNVTATAGVYTYTISTEQRTGCDPTVVTGSITVNPQPEVTINDVVSGCPNVQTVTVTGTLTNGTAPYNYTWNVGTLEVAAGSSATIIGSNSTSPTVNVIIPTSPCNANYPIGLTVTDDKGCTSTYNPTNRIAISDNGGPTLIDGMDWPEDQVGSFETYPGLEAILNRVATIDYIASLYEDDCTETVNVVQGTPIQDSTADCGWGVRVPYTISDDCGNSFTNYINVTGGDNSFSSIASKDTVVECPSQLLTQAQMESLVPQVRVCGVTREIYFDSISDSISESCGKRVYYYHYFDANNESYSWTFTFRMLHTTLPSEYGTRVPTSATVACVEDAVLPATMPEIRDACGNLLATPVDTVITESQGNLINCNGYKKYAFKYSDCAGLDTTWTFTYTIHDSILPVIDPIAQQEAIPVGNCQYKMPDLRPLTIGTDNCGHSVSFVSQSPDTNARFDQPSTPQSVTVTVTVADECGNLASRQVQVQMPASNASVTAPTDKQICPGASVELTASGAEGTVSYEWYPAAGLNNTYGSTVTASPSGTTTYTVVATNTSGCKDTDYVTVTINSQIQQTSGIQTVSSCNSYVWTDGNGNTYTTSTNTPTYMVPGGNAAGCDSTVTLHLTIHYNDTTESTEHVCGEYTWQGVTYTTDSDLTQYLQNRWQCDSIVTLHLKIHQSYHFVDAYSLCEGESYDYHGDTYTTDGPHDVSFTSAYGCDSVYTLNLEVLPTMTVTIDTLIDCINGWYEFKATSVPESQKYSWSSQPSNGAASEHWDGDVIRVTPTVPTTYYVTVGYGENMRCPQTDTIDVDEFIIPRAEMSVHPPFVTTDNLRWYGDYETFGDHETVTRQWYVDGFPYDQQTQHIYGDYDLNSGHDSVIVDLIARSKQCADTAHIAIPYYLETLYVPNVFTPGLDCNNLFGPEGVGIVELEMWVYNREGMMVFHGTGMEEKWDGTHNGKNCPTSTYTYRINYSTVSMPNGPKTMVGTVMLMR